MLSCASYCSSPSYASRYLCSAFCLSSHLSSFFFFFNDTATTEIYTLSLHDALPIWYAVVRGQVRFGPSRGNSSVGRAQPDRKSTRLNSSHGSISYAVFCLKKKKKRTKNSNIPTTTTKRKNESHSSRDNTLEC